MIIGISGKIGSGKDTVAKMINIAVTSAKYGRTNLDPIELQHQLSLPVSWGVFEVRRFADTLKQFVSQITGCTVEQLEDPDFKDSPVPKEWWRTSQEARSWLHLRLEYDPFDEDRVIAKATELGFKWERTYREMLQELGTNVLREYHPNFHVNTLMVHYKRVHKHMFAGVSAEYTYNPVLDTNIQDFSYPDWIIPDVRFPNEAQAIKDRNGIVIRVNRSSKSTGTHSSETALDNYPDFDVVIDNTGTLEDLYQNVTDIVKQFKLQQYDEGSNNRNE